MGASIATAPEVVNDLAATRGKGEQHRQSRLLLNLRVNVYIHCIVNFIIVVCSCRGPSSAGGFGSTYQVLSLSCPYFPSFLTQIKWVSLTVNQNYRPEFIVYDFTDYRYRARDGCFYLADDLIVSGKQKFVVLSS